MFTLGIPNRQYRRADSVLQNGSNDPIDHEVIKQDDGFYLFSFPSIDEFEFKNIILLLKNNGVTTIGADDQLTERKIMKLTDLINEDFSKNLDESDGDNLIIALKNILQVWQTKQYADDKSRWEEYYMDIQELVEDFEEERSMDTPAPSQLANLQEQKVRKAIRKLMRQ